MEYKYVVLVNTTLGIIMSSINMNIVMISLPAIFRGLGINPFQQNEFVYLLWILMGYSITLASLLITFGRISDMFGRTRMYTWGFIIFTIFSILLSLIPSNSGNFGAMLIILFRIGQSIGGGFLMVNSSALLTDTFPPNERGKALGLNQSSMIIGSVLGLVLGGFLAGYDWHLVFIVNIPFAIAGTLWSIFRLKNIPSNENIKIDYIGNILLVASLIFISLGFTYVLEPYGNSQLGWNNPWVIGAFISGIIFLFLFILYERKAENPLFNLSLFRIRPFLFGNLALFFNALARGAIMFLVTIWLQGIYLPLHGYSYSETPLWAGIYILPMMVGMVAIAPFSGYLTDKYGARIFATSGMILVGLSIYLLTLLPYNFNLLEFESIMVLNGIGNGLFASPNTTSIMNSLKPSVRGVGNGIRMTLNNIGSTISMAMFFSITITEFSNKVPSAMFNAVKNILPLKIAEMISNIPGSGLLFATFLGINPIDALPPSIVNSLSPQAYNLLSSPKFLPNVIGPAFIDGLRISLYISVILVSIGAIFSILRGKKYIYEIHGDSK